jgi:enoyl-CoA hydratase
VGELVRVEIDEAVATVRLDRPPMNALSAAVLDEIAAAAAQVSADPAIRAVVLYGGPKVFAAGADVKEMSGLGYAEMSAVGSRRLQNTFIAVARIGKPVIAAITGYALGGGLELALCADFRVLGESAKVGQPEILLGIIPGAGGTQRLPRFIGKAKAMDLCLTGRMMDATEAERAGLVSRIVPADKLLEEAISVAARIAGMSQPVAMMVKEAVNRAFETTLAEGVRFERRLFHATFGTGDQKEGMAAFVEKRKPAFRNR